MSEEVEIGLLSAISALLGVLIGGVLTFFIQWHFIRRDEKKRGRVQLIRVQFLVNSCATHIVQLGRALRRGIPTGHEGHLWPVVLPIASPDHSSVEVPVDDLSVLKGDIADAFVNLLAEVARIHNIAHVTLTVFNSTRTELKGKLAPLSQISPQTNSATVAFDARQHPDIIALMHECESLIGHLLELTEEGTKKSALLTEAFNKVAQNSKSRIAGKRVPQIAIDADSWRLQPKSRQSPATS